MSSDRDSNTDHATEWGAYGFSGWRRAMVAAAYAVPAHWSSAERISRRLIRPIRRGGQTCYDVVIWGLRLRLTDRGNRSERRLLHAPQFFDIEERAFLARHLRPDTTFVDIGANVGAFAYWAHRCMSGRGCIIAFEPDPEMRARLKFNLACNAMRYVKVESVALSDHSGSSILYVDQQQRGRNTLEESIADSGDVLHLQVQLDTLCNRLEAHGVSRIDALKIDIEGHELPVMRHFFLNAPVTVWPKAVLAEVIHDAGDELHTLLTANGYRCVMRSDLNRGYEICNKEIQSV